MRIHTSPAAYIPVAILALLDLGVTQTIQIGSETLAANQGTVAPAAVTVPDDVQVPDLEHFSFEKTQLTQDVISNLTRLSLTDAALFSFGEISNAELEARANTSECKAYPGTSDWPSDTAWKVLDILSGGALIKNVPLAAPCYNSWPSVRSNESCAYVTAHWREPRFQVDAPGSVSFPLYEGATCAPSDNPDGNCTLGGYPSYVVNVTNVAQIQLAVNFARNANLRFVIKNKGHDFNAKSTGGGGLSVFTGFLRDIRHIPHYERGPYSGPAFKIGTGVEVGTLYQVAESLNLSVVGGIGRTVGLAGGYMQGGGHSPLVSVYGMAADQVLSMEVVLPDGRFVTINEDHYPDLYWAIRGGGGSTFGVVVSAVVAAYPKIPISSVSYNFTTGTPGTNISADAFWAGMQAFWDTFLPNNEAGHYCYFKLTCATPDQIGNCTFSTIAHFAPNSTAPQLRQHQSPLFTRLSALGFPVEPVYSEYPSLYTAFAATFPVSGETAGGTTNHVGSRLFPRSNWASPPLLSATASAIRRSVEAGGKMIAYNVRAAPNPRVNQTNAVNPAWRAATMFAMMADPHPAGASVETIVEKSEELLRLMEHWREVTPGAGSYLNEGDINEPGFRQAFYGEEGYERLYGIKRRYDPTGTFYAATGVGSEDWYVTGQVELYPTSNGRLCRVRK